MFCELICTLVTFSRPVTFLEGESDGSAQLHTQLAGREFPTHAIMTRSLDSEVI